MFGVINICRYKQSPMLGVINICRYKQSPTLGVINICRYKQSPTLGVVNICRYKQSPMLGVVNILDSQNLLTTLDSPPISEILVEDRDFFIPYLHSIPHEGVPVRNCHKI